MKFLLSGALAVLVIAALIVTRSKKYRGIILLAFGAAFFALSAFQTFRTAGIMLPFYHPKEQTFYQEEFINDGLYPDAFLQLILKGKTVHTKDDLDEYIAENVEGKEAADSYGGKYWTYQHYHQNNITGFLEAAGAEVLPDDAYNKVSVPDEKMDDFSDIGYANDMYRYLFPLSDYNEEWSNSFYYYWYYSQRIEPFNIYINPEGIDETDELVLLWDEEEAENLYIMTKDYYEKEVA